MSTPAPGAVEPAALEVEDRLYRALAVLRVVVTVNMIALALWRRANFEQPVATVVAVVLLVLWTGLALLAYDRRAARTAWLLVADLAIAVAAIGVTPWLKGEDFRATLPGFWVMGALLAWAVHWHWRGGLAAGVALSLVDVLSRQELTQTNYGHIFLMLLGGTVVGYMCQSLQEMAADRARAERVAAAAAERTRLARAVHDGVLQVLSLVQRRGREAGGDLADLARLAGEQEEGLRSLIRAQDSLVDATVPVASGTRGGPRRPAGSPGLAGSPGACGWTDLRSALEACSGRGVTVTAPGTPVLLPGHRARELTDAVGACLDNVRRHVGEDAPAWVMLEATDGEVRVSVRDEGPGIPSGRLEEAAAEGRLGVAESIRGRLRDLGGTADLHTDQHGTEWELAVPREQEEDR